ncbi:MAG: hypothetical protein C3F07_05185 [Anaerolineales bacterium]|nr:LysM peptidoglycan-binding domain-containing protein [Anaerolineae bacterium]PWB75729.1 MAG: hypothetical protein C3F07_05185 [Anaerolineales bacterium]
MNLVHGVDVSVFEPRVDWRALRAQGFRFALIRATSGIGYVDPKFAEHWAGAREAGLLRGAYHYLIAGQDPGRQADLFIATVGNDKGELPPIVDLEDAYNEKESNSRIIASCEAVLKRLDSAFGRKSMVYSRKTYLQVHVTVGGRAPAWAKDYDLWVAQYPYVFNSATMPNVNMPMQPDGWKAWKFWQYSETAIVEGVTDEYNRPTRIDLNWFRGTEAELYQFANVQPAQALAYTVKAGDTFKSIADQHDLTLTELLDANPALLQVGASLTIPGRVQIPTPPEDTGEDTSSQPQDNSGGTPGTKPVVTHTVKKGDTLSGIALKYGTTVDAIMAINPQITNRNIISIGQVIVIP